MNRSLSAQNAITQQNSEPDFTNLYTSLYLNKFASLYQKYLQSVPYYAQPFGYKRPTENELAAESQEYAENTTYQLIQNEFDVLEWPETIREEIFEFLGPLFDHHEKILENLRKIEFGRIFCQEMVDIKSGESLNSTLTKYRFGQDVFHRFSLCPLLIRVILSSREARENVLKGIQQEIYKEWFGKFYADTNYDGPPSLCISVSGKIYRRREKP